MAKDYPTDLAEAEWAVLEPLLPAAKPGGRPRTTSLRQVVEAIFYVLRSGCQWRMLPKEFPPYQTHLRQFGGYRCPEMRAMIESHLENPSDMVPRSRVNHY